MSLVKLKLESFTKPDCSGTAIGSISLLVNPKSYSQQSKIDYQAKRIVADPAQTLDFSGFGRETLTLSELLVDGTGVVPLTGASTVDDYIEKLSKVVYKYNGTIHRPPYVKVTWGNLTFTGVCKSFKVNYTLFNPDGTALRALVDISLDASVAMSSKAMEAAQQSPDLTHIRTVKAGDTLPLMTYRIYGDISYYLEVARINNLTSLNAIKPGDQIYFPSLKK